MNYKKNWLFVGQGAGFQAVECDTGIFQALEELGFVPEKAIASSGSALFCSLYYSGFNIKRMICLEQETSPFDWVELVTWQALKTAIGKSNYCLDNSKIQQLLLEEMTFEATERVQVSVTRMDDYSTHLKPATPDWTLAATSIPFVFKTLKKDGFYSLPESLNIQKDGTFSFHGATFQIAVGDARWRFVSNKNWKEQKSRVAPSGAQFSGTILPGSGRGSITESITPAGTESAELHAVLTMQEPVRLNRISGNFSLPADRCAILVDGKAVNVPERPEKARLYAGWSKEVVLRTFGAEELVIRPAGGRVIIQDNRKVSQKNDTVSVMFCFQPEGGEVSRAELKLNMTVRKIAGVPVPLEKFVTRAFREEPGNTLPVWTLQV